MEDSLKKALEFANYRETLSAQRKILKDKIAINLIYGYNGGIFKINQTLISFVQTLINKNRTNNVVLLDENYNPILISDLNEFFDEILSRYFEYTLEYYEQYQKIKKSRSVESLVNL